MATDARPPLAEVFRLAPQIGDELVRDAAVMGWIRENRGGARGGDAERLCGLVSPRERGACTRQLAAEHLTR